MKIKMLLALPAVFLLSCSSDNDGNNASVSIQGYKITTEYANLPGEQYIVHGNLQNHRFFSETRQTVVNGLVTEEATDQKYFYEGDRVVSFFSNPDFQTYLQYDSEGRLSAAGLATCCPFTFSFPEPNTVYFQRNGFLPRYVGVFDSEDNLIQVSRDANSDGIVDSTNTFVYTNGDLTTVTLSNGTTYNFAYTDILDTREKLRRDTFGTRTSRALCIEMLSRQDIESIRSCSGSKHIAADDKALYEIGPGGFYKKKSTVDATPEWTHTVVEEFFFD